MSAVDWVVLSGTILFIVGYGTWKTRGIQSVESYLRGDNQLKWYTIGLSVMATQASAITFLSTPGQAYEDGMRFVQFYFGLPLAMVVLCVFVIPVFYRLRVFTAYEYLETRFDLKTRQLAALLFLLQRGLSAGITIYAPAIILSSILGWPLNVMNVAIGALVIVYTVSGGTKAVSQTQMHQMVVILGGMALACVFIVRALPADVSLLDAVRVAGASGRLNAVDFSFNLDSRYTFWSGITGGFFLALAYFGTDQSQVQRYLSGRSITQSRLGLLFNGLLKVPMQFLVLFIGVMVFVFYQFEKPPVFFNQPDKQSVYATPHADALRAVEAEHGMVFERQRQGVEGLLAAYDGGDAKEVRQASEALRRAQAETHSVRERAKAIIAKANPNAETKDADYIFITFILSFLPVGLVGLLLAVILSAAMSSTASELNALGTTTMVDFYRRTWVKNAKPRHYLIATKLFTVFWGVLAILFASLASLVDNLIQAVNILGSIFYGTVLGIFLVALFIKHVRAGPVFGAALVSQGVVVALFVYSSIGFLWYNVIGCGLVVLLSLLAQTVRPRPAAAPAH